MKLHAFVIRMRISRTCFRPGPATMRMFNQAVDDTSAVIGRVYVPILELWGKEVRMLGDFLSTLLPTTKDVGRAFSSAD